VLIIFGRHKKVNLSFMGGISEWNLVTEIIKQQLRLPIEFLDGRFVNPKGISGN